MITIEHIKELENRVSELEKYLQIDKKRIEIANEEEKTFAPDFWDNPKEAQLLVQKLQSQKKWVTDYEKSAEMVEELQIMLDFYKENVISAED